MTSNGPKQTALAASLACNGYAFLPSWLPEEPSSELARSTGRQLNFPDKDPVQRLVPKATAGHNNYSGIFGLGAFPFHSDLAHWPVPPRYLMLRCIKGYGDVSTDLVDSMALVEGVGASDLSRALSETS